MSDVRSPDDDDGALRPVLTRIPFNRPTLGGREFEYMRAAMRAGHVSGDGEFTRRCNTILRELVGAKAAMLTTSCTHALDLSALVLDVQPGDEVVVPSFTFVSTVNAFALRGAKPVFIDIRPDTLNMDERLIERHFSKRTKAIIVVHYAGVGAEMDALVDLAQEHRVPLVEDNAHGLFGRYRGRPLGSFGELSTLSFHETKNLHCGEGGALTINEPSLVKTAEVMREKGTNRSSFFRGEINKYTWVELGSSYLPSDLLAAFLCAQLEAYPQLQARRQFLWGRYFETLAPWARVRGTGLPFVPDYCTHPAHIFYLLLRDEDERRRLIGHLDSRQIHAVSHYVPLHSSPQGARLGGLDYACPVTDLVSQRLIRLPLYSALTDEEQDRVIDAVLSFR